MPKSLKGASGVDALGGNTTGNNNSAIGLRRRAASTRPAGPLRSLTTLRATPTQPAEAVRSVATPLAATTARVDLIAHEQHHGQQQYRHRGRSRCFFWESD